MSEYAVIYEQAEEAWGHTFQICPASSPWVIRARRCPSASTRP